VGSTAAVATSSSLGAAAGWNVSWPDVNLARSLLRVKSSDKALEAFDGALRLDVADADAMEGRMACGPTHNSGGPDRWAPVSLARVPAR